MKYRITFIVFLLTTTLILLFFLTKKPEKQTLRLLTYSSFAGVYGPGKPIEKIFEKTCNCKLQWFLAEDSTALLQRFSIIPNMDLIIGWDQITLKSAQTEKWEELSALREELISPKITSILKSEFFLNPHFLPIDWAPIGFLYKNKTLSSIQSLKSMLKITGQISFPEPGTSALGLQWYYWIYEIFQGDKKQIADFLKKLQGKVYGPVFSWSMAYGFFQKGKTDMSLSYLSSLFYHQKEEPEKSYFFSFFKEGHPYQVEYISISQSSKNKKLAVQFAKFLLSQEAQQILQEKHYMFSVSKGMPIHNILKKKKLQTISYDYLDSFLQKKDELLYLWTEILY